MKPNMKPNMNSRLNEDKDYVVKIIQFLQIRHGFTFFITTKDFDALYNWWEKHIPIKIVKESINRVVERWAAKNKPITGFQNFKYEVRKSFDTFLQLNVGSESEGNTEKDPQQSPQSPYHDIEVFFQDFPAELQDLHHDYDTLFQQLKDNQQIDPDTMNNTCLKLTNLFKDNEELNLKTALFLKNLAPPLRKPQIEQKFRQNFLINKYKIPDFDI